MPTAKCASAQFNPVRFPETKMWKKLLCISAQQLFYIAFIFGVFYFSLFSCLVVIPWTAFHFTPMSPVQLGTLLLAGTCAAGGQFAITRAYTYAPAKKISIYDYSQIIFATILGYVIFGEIPDRLSFAGYTLIVTASLVMFLYNRRGDRQEEKKG